MEKKIILNKLFNVKTFHETVYIAQAGSYKTESGKIVELPNNTEVTAGTVFYSKEFSVENLPSFNNETMIEALLFVITMTHWFWEHGGVEHIGIHRNI